MRLARALTITSLPAIGGCLGIGISDMTPAQIAATNGMATCTVVQSVYGTGRSVTVNADNVRKGDTARAKITFGNDCTMTIDTNTAPAPTPAKQ